METCQLIDGRRFHHPTTGQGSELWGIVLAAGDGQRLAGLTEKLVGKSCPKQYCAIIGKRSMLQHTLHRAEQLIAPERILTVVSPAHRAEIRAQLGDRPPGSLLFQPINRETGPGVLFPLMAIHKRDPEATIAIFPSDHFILEEERFMASVRLAALAVEQDPAWLILLGVEADEPETEYGWIEAGKAVACFKGGAVHEVRQFWEKPDRRTAEELLATGALWSTLVAVVKAETLLAMARRYLPGLYAQFGRIQEALGRPEEERVLEAEYATMPSVTFSRGLLEPNPAGLGVLPVKGVLWTDWGNAARILKTLERIGRLQAFRALLQERGYGPGRFPRNGGERGSVKIPCPYLKKIRAKGTYPVEEYCEAYPDGRLHIPSLSEYQLLCTSGDYRSCELYCCRRGQEVGLPLPAPRGGPARDHQNRAPRAP